MSGVGISKQTTDLLVSNSDSPCLACDSTNLTTHKQRIPELDPCDCSLESSNFVTTSARGAVAEFGVHSKFTSTLPFAWVCQLSQAKIDE